MERTGSLRRWLAIGVAMLLPGFTGCSGFFPPVTNTGGNTGGGSTTGNSVYVANLTTSSITGFSIIAATAAVPATSTTPATAATPAALTNLSNSPLAAGYQPLSMAVTPNNAFLYVGGVSGIYLYLIGSNGSLSTPSTGPNQAVAYAASLTVSPDGQWLIALDGTTQQLDIFQINSSNGALTSVGANAPATYTVASGVWTPTSVRISPNGALIFAALGTGGDAIFTFNTSTGAAVSSAYLPTGNTTTADFGIAIDPKTAYLYIARSGTNGGVAVYSIGSGGSLAPVKGSPFAAGNGTYSIVLDPTGTYVYAANRTDGSISGFTIVPGTTTAALTLTPLSGSPYASGSTVQSIGIDSTGKYLLAAAPGGNPDLTMYSFDATIAGKLDPATTAATDTDPAGAVALALTH
jgi:6-phosphogluconolactonase